MSYSINPHQNNLGPGLPFPTHKRKRIAYPIPRRYEDIIRVIWQECGAAVFVWHIIAPIVPDGSGVLKRLGNTRTLLDCGSINPNGHTNQRTWKLAPDIVSRCAREFGEVDDDREERCRERVDEYRNFLIYRYSYKGRKEFEKSGGVPFSAEEQQMVASIARQYGSDPWNIRKVKKDLGYPIGTGMLRRWRCYGTISVDETVERGARHPKFWRISEAYLQKLRESNATKTGVLA
jgi:hypothetical protein